MCIYAKCVVVVVIVIVVVVIIIVVIVSSTATTYGASLHESQGCTYIIQQFDNLNEVHTLNEQIMNRTHTE
jgi:preprotein translocase subunit SecG